MLVQDTEEYVIYKLIEPWALVGYTKMQLHVYFILSFLPVLTQLADWIVFIFIWWTLNPSPVFGAIKSFCLLGCFTVVSIRRTQHFESEVAKRSGGANMLIFHNSTPALMVLIVKQNNAVEDNFLLSYKTLKQKKDRTKKSKIKMKVRLNKLIL